MRARDMALYTVRVTFMQEHGRWLSHDERETTGWKEHTTEMRILSTRHYEDEGHAAIREHIRRMFRNHGKRLPDGELYRLEILPETLNVDAIVEFVRS